MHIELNERVACNAHVTMYFAGFDNENVARAGLEFLGVDIAEAAALSYKLDFIARMTMGPGTTARQAVEKEHRNIGVTVVGPNELVRAALKRQVLLADAIHVGCSLEVSWKEACWFPVAIFAYPDVNAVSRARSSQ
ncbi:MAG: hypothetical protein ABIR58_06630 [Gemmatimonadaceae bacterium]